MCLGSVMQWIFRTASSPYLNAHKTRNLTGRKHSWKHSHNKMSHVLVPNFSKETEVKNFVFFYLSLLNELSDLDKNFLLQEMMARSEHPLCILLVSARHPKHTSGLTFYREVKDKIIDPRQIHINLCWYVAQKWKQFVIVPFGCFRGWITELYVCLKYFRYSTSIMLTYWWAK